MPKRLKNEAQRLQVRIENDVAPRVRRDAKAHGRSAQKEVNHVLRGVYRTAISIR